MAAISPLPATLFDDAGCPPVALMRRRRGCALFESSGQGYVVLCGSSVQMEGAAEAMDDDDAVRAAIEEHRRVTGWTGWVVLAPAAMTKSEWLAHYGGAD